MTGVSRAGDINVGSMDVEWKGTVINAVGDSAGGVINIQSNGLTTYLDNRSDYFDSSTKYKPMQNINVGVTINLPEASQTNGVGIRLYTDTSDSNFPIGQMINVNQEGTNAQMKARIPVAEMLGWSNDLRSATEGRGTSSLLEQEFEKVPVGMQADVIRRIRERKGLSENQ